VSTPLLTFITSSKSKWAEVERLLGLPLTHANIPLEEIQNLALEPVVIHKAKHAYAQVQRPVLVEDTGLAFAAWNGLPGALVKWFLSALGTNGLCRLLQGESNRSATASTLFAYYDGTLLRVFPGTMIGSIPQTPRGSGGFGWDPLFQPLGSKRTFAEMSAEEKDQFSMRRLALDQLRASGLLDSR
jgi:non-canonical purine NTP pyrophosphatase (RdgB/HAM1 family)